VFWDVFGEQGHPVRATVSDMGPLLPYLVHTTWQHGLLDEHVPRALKILGHP